MPIMLCLMFYGFYHFLCSFVLAVTLVHESKMVSLNHQQHLRAGIARSHSSASVTASKKVSANSLTASDPDLAKQLYKANVKVAIDDRISGTSSKYDDLCAKFASPNSSAIELCQYLAALSHFVTYAPRL